MKTAITILLDDDYVVNGKQGGWAYRVDKGTDQELKEHYGKLLADMDYCLEPDLLTDGWKSRIFPQQLAVEFASISADIMKQICGYDTRKKEP